MARLRVRWGAGSPALGPVLSLGFFSCLPPLIARAPHSTSVQLTCVYRSPWPGFKPSLRTAAGWCALRADEALGTVIF